MKASVFLKSLVAYAVGFLLALFASIGVNVVSVKLGTTLGKRMAPLVGPLFNSRSRGRQALGVLLLVGAVGPVAGVMGALDSAVPLIVFTAVKKMVEAAIKDADWSAVDDLADHIEGELRDKLDVFGDVVAWAKTFLVEDEPGDGSGISSDAIH